MTFSLSSGLFQMLLAVLSSKKENLLAIWCLPETLAHSTLIGILVVPLEYEKANKTKNRKANNK